LDLRNQEDFLEEIAMALDYNKLPGLLPVYQPIEYHQEQEIKLRSLIGQYLINGYQEIITYSLVSSDIKNDFILSDKADAFYRVANPKNETHVYYRQSIIPSHLKTIIYNLSYQNKNLLFFEISEIYSQNNKEELLTLSGTGKIIDCSAHKLVEEIDYF
jgi:phenylalanyl-tRNA synthetase beta chain